MRRLTVVASMIGLGVCLAADTPTYAERLGWPSGARVLILHSDDAGMSHESNLGTIEAMTDGIVTSTSVMMPCPWVPDLLHRLKPHPQLDVGLHLTLTAEWKGFRWSPLAEVLKAQGIVLTTWRLPARPSPSRSPTAGMYRAPLHSGLGQERLR